MEAMQGGCQCGRIRYTVSVREGDDDAYLCHCRMCKRATGGVSIAFKSVRKDAVTWSQEPDWFRSSPIARRPFCSRCGTPLGFAFPDSGTMDLTVGSFDEPYRFLPKHNYAAESMHQGWLDVSALPRIRSDENEAVVKRWMDTVGKLPD